MSKPYREISSLDTPANPPNSQAEISLASQSFLCEERSLFSGIDHSSGSVPVGTASDTAFAMQFYQTISVSEYDGNFTKMNYITDEKIMNLSNQDCSWPTPTRARLLVNIALKYISRTFHIIRRSQILEGLEQIIQNPNFENSSLKQKLWAIFAIGEIYSTHTTILGKDFPGIAYFSQATRGLGVTDERPHIDAIEIRLLLVSIHVFSRRLS